MKTIPNLQLSVCSLLFLSAGCFTTAEKDAWKDEFTGKNVTEVEYRTITDASALLTSDEKGWNFNFRPYGSSSSTLWSDPATQREILAGDSADAKASALHVSCNADGVTALVLCTEPGLTNFYAKAASAPLQTVEFYVLPGDTDSSEVAPYYWLSYHHADSLTRLQWLMNTRRYRHLSEVAETSEEIYGHQIIVKIFLPWEVFWDRLPVFDDKIDNFWRLGVVRYSSAGLMTYGGVVHEPSRAGYIRWPKFTEAQKSEILERTLFKAWDQFNTLKNKKAYSLGAFPDGKHLDKRRGYKGGDRLPYREEQNAADRRSYVNYAEDPLFRPVYENSSTIALRSDRNSRASSPLRAPNAMRFIIARRRSSSTSATMWKKPTAGTRRRN